MVDMRSLAVLLAAAMTLVAGCGSQTGSSSAEDAPAAAASSSQPTGASPSQNGSKDGTKDGSKDGGATKQADPVEVPDSLTWTAQTVGGDDFDAADLAGKPVVLWFWAPWCPTCRGQIPWVGALADKYGDKVSVVGVGGLDSSDAMPDFANQVANSVTNLSDPEGEIWRRFAITSQSTFVVLDAQGVEQASGSVSQDDLTGLVADLAG